MNEHLQRYIKPADEADMRVRFKNVLKMQGQEGLCQVLGEMAACVQVCLEVLEESRRT